MKKKRILIYSLDFMPDHSGISIYSSDFAKYCCENDFQVEVITGFPFYPNYKKLDKDKGKLFRKDNINGITVRRGYLYVPEDPIPRKRIIHEISFLIFAFINSFLVKKPDFVVVFTTPVLLGVLAAFFNKFWKAKLIINVQDFQIEAAESLGMLKKSFMLKILESAEKWSYKNSDIVTSISQGMVELLQKKKEIEKKRTFLWPNWIHTSLDNLSLTKGEFRKKHNISEKISLIAYAGNIGHKQGLKDFILLAKHFESNQSVKFILAGNGGAKENLVQLAKNENIINIIFLDFLNQNEYQKLLIDIDLFFISQVKVPQDIYFPSKLLGIMQLGVPTLVYADTESELFKTLNKAGTSVMCPFGQKDALFSEVNKILTNEDALEKLSTNSKIFSISLSRDTILKKVLNKILI